MLRRLMTSGIAHFPLLEVYTLKAKYLVCTKYLVCNILLDIDTATST